MTSLLVEATPPLAEALTPSFAQSESARLSKAEIRRSLRASTLDGSFSSVFENIVKGVLISNFLLELGAGAFEVGLLTSIPMLAHLLQPLGAYFSEKVNSRHAYCLWIFGFARLLWLIPAVGIFMFSRGALTAQMLTFVTMAVLSVSNILEAIGCASWMSWMAVLVPGKLRGRYFSLRRSLSSLTALLTIPIGGWLVSGWMGGELEGYALVLIVAVLLGLASLGFQFYMSDINPQAVNQAAAAKEASQAAIDVASGKSVSEKGASGQFLEQEKSSKTKAETKAGAKLGIWQDRNFLMLLLFLGVWTFSVNLSAPFFNFYLLDRLQLDVQWVTVYSSLRYGGFFLAIMLWGRLADRIGNRPVMIINCVLAASIPFMWSYVDAGVVSVWLALPMLHLLQGGTFAALELCLANIQLELAPVRQQSAYFAIAAAVMGVTGALGTTAGGYLAELSAVGLPALFALTAVIRLLSITPLAFVKEARAQSIRQIIDQRWQRLPQLWQPARIKA
ncbi:MAG: Major Facilitator Superfamily [Phormidesmis priestleyi Ana]|uniref:Major Facilitator Superfamily n=1 Tax=Phormidesmis priestleyi Ana TaxID=1666911 RepID=A0A0P7YQU1_9CYAN|nr:MAG: Major Facilitator Superfamily [Phormidesmis priestleyi Ana]